MNRHSFKIPVISGIHTYNFIEVFEKLERVDGAIEIETDIHLLVKAIKSLLENNDYYQQIGNKGFQVLRENQGALERHLTLLKPYLEKEE